MVSIGDDDNDNDEEKEMPTAKRWFLFRRGRCTYNEELLRILTHLQIIIRLCLLDSHTPLLMTLLALVKVFGEIWHCLMR